MGQWVDVNVWVLGSFMLMLAGFVRMENLVETGGDSFY